MKLNLGCGHDRRPGYLNVDSHAGCAPDLLLDLERLPWPFDSDSADEILLKHVLEHLGRRTADFLKIVQELYRVARDGCLIRIELPHPRSDNFLGDPTHVRPILPDTLLLFSKAWLAAGRLRGSAATPLADILGVDFEIAACNFVLMPRWQERLERGQIDQAGLQEVIAAQNNVVANIEIDWRAIKPPAAA